MVERPRPHRRRKPTRRRSITDGGGESRTVWDGFGWELRDAQSARISLDTHGPRAGARSLRLDFNGISDAAAHLSQLVLVKPNSRYRLNFAARTQEIVTGGLPVITVTDASRDGRVLAQSSPLPPGTSGWQDYSVEFASSDATSAVYIILQRQHCPDPPCPIFGSLWLDDFSLQKLS